MSTLSALQADLSRLKSKKKDLEAKLKVQRDRLSKVDKLPAQIMSVSAERYGAVNTRLNNAADQWVAMASLDDSGIMETRASGMVADETEPYCVDDADLARAIEELNADSFNTKRIIRALELEIEALKQRIAGVEDQIQAEEQRLAEERREKIKQTIFDLFIG